MPPLSSELSEITRQLTAEIESLQAFIRKLENQSLATQWTAELLGPFEQYEGQFSDPELRQVVNALYRAKASFGVNGELSNRIDAILTRYPSFAPTADLDPADSESSHEPSLDSVSELFDSHQSDPPQLPASAFEPGSREPTDVDTPGGEPGVDSSSEPASLEADFQDQLQSVGPADETDSPAYDVTDELATSDAEDAAPHHGDQAPVDAGPFFERAGIQPDSTPDGDDQTDGDLPAASSLSAPESQTEEARPQAIEEEETTQDALRPRKTPSGERPTPQFREPVGTKREGSLSYESVKKSDSPVDIFTDTISVDDLLACLGISLPQQDIMLLEQKKDQRKSDGVIQALQYHEQAEGRYYLIPRLNRVLFNGQQFPCTIKTLARMYTTLFGGLRDLVPFRGDPLFEYETPEVGWAIVLPECPRETLGRDFAEQNQSMRIMGPSVGLPSHSVRRRKLVEAVYDLIVAKLVLSKTLQSTTLDWTSSGLSRKSFASVYFPDAGLRIRELPRSTKHGALGCCPNW